MSLAKDFAAHDSTRLTGQPRPLVVLLSQDAALAARVARAMETVDWQVQVLTSMQDDAAERLLSESQTLVYDSRLSRSYSGVSLGELSLVAEGVPVVVLADGPSSHDVVGLIRRGASTVVDLHEGLDDLCPAIQESICVRRERSEFEAAVQDAKGRLGRLKKPERDVADLVMRGYRNCAIARALSLSQRSIEARRAKAMRTMNAASPVEFAYRMLLAELADPSVRPAGEPDPFATVRKRWFADFASNQGR